MIPIKERRSQFKYIQWQAITYLQDITIMLDSAQQIPSIVVIPVNEHAISEKWLNKYGAFPKDGKSLSFLSDARRFV